MKTWLNKKIDNSLNWESDQALRRFEENKMAEKDKKKILQMEERISSIANEIQLQLTAGKDILKISLTDFKDVNELVEFILNKDNRKSCDVFVLMQYLKSYPSFIELLTGNEGLTELKDLLYKVALFLKKEEVVKDEIIFLNGQLGKNFYLILDGEVSVLVPVEQSVYITNIQFFKYLQFLLDNKEYELIRKTFESNQKNFSEFEYQISEYEKFSSLLETFLPASSKFGNQDCFTYVNKFNHFINNLVNLPNSDENENDEKDDEYEQQKLKEILNSFDSDTSYENNKKSRKNSLFIKRKSIYKKTETENSEEKNKNKNKKKEINKFDYIKHKYFIWKYNLVCTLGKGKSFGELALQKEGSRRTATIIANKKCKFGTLQKDEYQVLVKETLERARKINVEALMHSEFFHRYRIDLFESHYFNCFKYMKKVKGEYLFIQNTRRDNIFFIKKGDIQIELLSSWNNLDNVLISLGINHRKNIDWQNLISSNEKLKIFVSSIKKFNISIFSSGEIIGTEEHATEKGKKYMFSALCISNCEIFSLEINFLDKMLNEKILKNNYSKMALEKKNKLVQRIVDLKTNTLYQYNNMTERKYLPLYSFDHFSTSRLKQNALKVKKKLLFLSHEISSFKELNNKDNKDHSNIHINNIFDSKINSDRDKRKNCISYFKTRNDFFQMDSYNKINQNSLLNSTIINKKNLYFNNISINKAINEKNKNPETNQSDTKFIPISNDLTIIYNNKTPSSKHPKSFKFNKTSKESKITPHLFIENELSKTNNNFHSIKIKCSIANRVPKKLIENVMTYNTVIDKLLSKKKDLCKSVTDLKEKKSSVNEIKSKNLENNSITEKTVRQKELNKFDVLMFDNFMSLIAKKHKKNNASYKKENNESIKKKMNYNKAKLLPLSYATKFNFYKERKKLILDNSK